MKLRTLKGRLPRRRLWIGDTADFDEPSLTAREVVADDGMLEPLLLDQWGEPIRRARRRVGFDTTGRKD